MRQRARPKQPGPLFSQALLTPAVHTVMMQRTAWILFKAADGSYYCPSMPTRVDGFSARDLVAVRSVMFGTQAEAKKAADRLNGKGGFWSEIFS